MPPDITGCVRQFLPNNGGLATVVIKVLKNVYQANTLPMDLVKQVVMRALEQSRTMDMRVDTPVFEEKLTQYANQLRPRYAAKLASIRKQGKKW